MGNPAPTSNHAQIRDVARPCSLEQCLTAAAIRAMRLRPGEKLTYGNIISARQVTRADVSRNEVRTSHVLDGGSPAAVKRA